METRYRLQRQTTETCLRQRLETGPRERTERQAGETG